MFDTPNSADAGAVLAQCVGKHAFLSCGTALKAIRHPRHRGGKGKMAPYKCTHCFHWHIGSTPKR